MPRRPWTPSTGVSLTPSDPPQSLLRARNPTTLRVVRNRPAIVSIEDDLSGDDARVTVRLDWADQAYYGQAIGTSGERVRLAGEAALDAVTRMVSGGLDLELLAVATTDLGAASIALAQVRLGDDELIGGALQGEVDAGLAAVRAVMDAINRRLELVL